MLMPWLMLASVLSTVTTRGELMVLMVQEASAAESRRFRLAAQLALPITKHTAPPVLAPVGSGMLTAKLGVVTPSRPVCGAVVSSAPPAMETMLGKMRPVGLPKVGASETLP